MSDNYLKITEQEFVDVSISDMFEDHLLQAVLTLVQDGICFLSKDLDVLYANPAMRYWYEIGEESIGKKCYQTYHGRDSACEDCPALRALDSGNPEVEERIYEIDKRRKGEQRVFSLPIQDANQETLMIIEYIRDISDEKRQSENLNFMKEQISVLTNLMHQKEKEQEQKERLLIGNMNHSFEVVLRYLKKILDENSFQLVENQLHLTKSGISGKHVKQNIFSGQELVIARYIAEGYLSKEIADKLNVSKKTIDYHRTNIRKKLKLKSNDNLKISVMEFLKTTDSI